MHPAIKLRHIRAFLAITAEGSLSAVARQSGISQPALSRALGELEGLLGQPLFLREGRRLVLTEAGALFRSHASLGVQALDQAAGAVGPDAGAGRLEVGLLPSVATRLFPKVALAFHAAAPRTILSVTTGPHFHLIRGLRGGELSAMLGRMPAAGEMADLTFEHLYEEEIVLVGRSGHPLAGRRIEEMLARCPVVLPPEGALIRRPVNEYLASLGLADLRPAYETVALALGRGIVAGSDALWFISRGVVLEELDRGELVTFETGARFLSGAVGITRRRDMGAAAELDILCGLLRDAVSAGGHL